MGKFMQFVIMVLATIYALKNHILSSAVAMFYLFKDKHGMAAAVSVVIAIAVFCVWLWEGVLSSGGPDDK